MRKNSKTKNTLLKINEIDSCLEITNSNEIVCSKHKISYNPLECIELPSEFSKLSTGKDTVIVSFAKRYGLKPFLQEILCEQSNFINKDFSEEDLNYIIESAKVIKTCLEFFYMIPKDERDLLIFAYSHQHINTGIHPPNFSNQGLNEMLFLGGWSEKGIDSEKFSKAMEQIIKTKKATAHFSFLGNVDTSTLHYQSNLDAIYWVIARSLSKLSLEKCIHCGTVFFATHGNSKYCPPRYKTSTSNCLMNSKIQKYRKKKNLDNLT